LNGETNRVRKKHNRAIIAGDVRRFGHVINKDGVLGAHTHAYSMKSPIKYAVKSPKRNSGIAVLGAIIHRF